ncbi:MAG: EAL domain-containing protein [Oscillospiraceae bacterium]|nr:EAL domain-containing protein [Oscillospiraceae bacterium]
MSKKNGVSLPKHLTGYTRPEMLPYIDWHLGLPNGLKLERDVREAAVKPALVVLDAISLREMNEVFGREMGDKLLEAIRDDIVLLNTYEFTLYHVSGGKFCAAMTGRTPEELAGLADALAARFKKTWSLRIGKNRLNILCDHVICVFPSEFTGDDETLLVMIERTLKSAKINDVGKVVFYNARMDEEFKQRRRFEFSIKRCVANGMEGFDVYYQAVADPVTGIWCGLEALCRWNSPELGPVPPTIFIPETERLDLIGTIGLWVLETAVRKCKEWGLDQYRKFILDVNVSANQFADALLAPKIIKILRDYDYPGEKLCLEITESTQFTFSGLSLLTIERIKAERVLVALDDFGTGYSAFNKLKEMPIDIVKVERIFVSGIEQDSYLRYLFRAMAELAHVSNMKIVAEGVETLEQMGILLKSGADYLQGYLFSKPTAPAEMEAMLSRFRETDESFNMIRKQKVDLSALFQMETDYAFSPALHRLLNQCTHILLHHKDIDLALQEVLELVGTHMDVSRTYAFHYDGENFYTNTHEWCADGISPQKDILVRVRAPDSLLTALSQDGILLSSDISALPADVAEEFTRQGIKSVAIIPLWDGNVLTGFIGFDDCLHHRDWRAEEILMLHNLCTIVASVMNRLRIRRESSRRMDILSDVLNHANMVVYVSAIDTGEILFANHYTNRLFGRDLTGEICWEAFQNRKEKCRFCKIGELLENPDVRECVWEHRNPVTAACYKVYDSLIPWMNGETVHLEYAVELSAAAQGS